MQTIIYILTASLLPFAWIIYVYYQKYQLITSSKITSLHLEIEKEYQKAAQLKEDSKEIMLLQKRTHQKLLAIKVAIFNIDFTFKEIL